MGRANDCQGALRHVNFEQGSNVKLKSKCLVNDTTACYKTTIPEDLLFLFV